jgi:steroid delta-isomerase-like uncharacterized protein
VSAQPASAARTRATVERYLEALNRHDADAVAACVADDFCNEHTSALGHSLRGRTAYRERLDGFLAQFRDLHYEVEDWIVDDDRAAVPYTMSCTYVDGDAAHDVTIRGIFRFRVVGDVIVHRVDYWDSSEFARQVQQEART